MQRENDSLIDILVLLYKKRKVIIAVCLISGILIAGASLMLPNFYEASTQFYAASPEMAQPSPLGSQTDEKEIYGTDRDIDRLISIAKSNIVTNYIIDSFDLYNHYEIDPARPLAKHKLLVKMEKLYTINKTKYDAVKLAFEDEDPEKAADMANAARDKVDALAQEMIKNSQQKLIESYKQNVVNKEAQYQAISDSLDRIRDKYKIFNTASQGEAFGSSMVELEGSIQNYTARLALLEKSEGVSEDSIAMTRAKLSGFQKQYQGLKKSIASYNEGYTSILRFERELRDFGEQMNLDRERLKQLQAAYGSEISAIHIVEQAETPVYKSRPKRSILVVGATMLVFVLMSLWVVVQDQLNRSDIKSKLRDA